MDILKDIWAKFRTLKAWQKFVVLLILYVLFSALTGFGSSTGSGSKVTSNVRSYPVIYVRHAVINPATISVAFDIKNDGTVPIKPKCTIRMQDASGTYKGFDYFDISDEIAANQTKEVVVKLTITKQGAEYVDTFSGECTATTSDTGTNAGESVVISDIQNMSATDSSEGWYWGASFKANQKPMTQMNCTVKALNKTGKVIGSHSYRANTVNDGTVVSYGQNERWDADASKEMVLSIVSFDVKCTL